MPGGRGAAELSDSEDDNEESVHSASVVGGDGAKAAARDTSLADMYRQQCLQVTTLKA
jgi:hypothetical protein